MVLTLTQKLHDQELPRHELETLLAEKGFHHSTYDSWQGGIIDKTTTPPTNYQGNWQIHKHKENKDHYAAIIRRGCLFQGIYQAEINSLRLWRKVREI